MSDTKNRLELYVSSKLEPTYKWSRPTIASGATPVEKGDVKNPYFCIECKDWSTKSFSIKDDVWQKIKGEADRERKDPVYIVENKHGNRLAIMDVDDWINLVIELVEYRKANNAC
jgi:PHD/YefM family antitoxin component YafN of YafNO toxin-antitoxin module